MPEPKIRELNDQINKLLRTKHHWEKRILELGGPNHIKQRRAEDVGYSGNYKYFGAAR